MATIASTSSIVNANWSLFLPQKRSFCIHREIFSSFVVYQCRLEAGRVCARRLSFRKAQENNRHSKVSSQWNITEGGMSNEVVGASFAKAWLLQGYLRNGILGRSRGLRYGPWRRAENSGVEVMVASRVDLDIEGLIGQFLSLRFAFTQTRSIPTSELGWKWVLSVAIGFSINFLPWSTDIGSTQPLPPNLRCEDVSQYYSQASGLKGVELKTKLHEIVGGHKPLSYAQVWNALKILDAADDDAPETSPDIVDIYSLKRLPKSLSGSSEGWNREHLWPRSYGLVEGRPEFTDVHNLRPADVNVNSSRGNKYFGDCIALNTMRCLVPANREAAADTATDANTWKPPTQVRGDIARAVLYMAVRYGIEQPSGSLNLQLSDSPSVANASMGLLSTLLQWNDLDPPTPSELLRNTRVCSLYQGNRNPFVDHPEYATSIWGGPEVVSQEPGIPNYAAIENVRKEENQLMNTWINEIHYNNKGQDQDEFIEVVGCPETDMVSLKVYLYTRNGSVYRVLPLADTTLFHRSEVAGSDHVFQLAALPGGSIQNGPADGIALVQEQSPASSRVLQFISYQGVLTATEGPAKGLISRDVGVQEGDTYPIGGSIGLSGAGQRYDDFKWTGFPRAASPGRVNSGQLIIKPSQ